MLKTPLFKHALALLFVIGVLDLIAAVFHLHWEYWWYDVILHFLGGAWATMTVILVWHYYSNLSASDRLKFVKIGVIGALTIGFLWEIYELISRVTSFSDGIFYWMDTASDLLMDICGGFFGALYSFRILSKNG